LLKKLLPSVPVLVHASQAPGAVAADLAASLHSRCVNHKFHYDSVKQTRQWLEIHRRYSPAANDENASRLYESAAIAAAGEVPDGTVEVVGLGCGSGWKDAFLLRALSARGCSAGFWAVDSSVPLTLIARENTTSSARLMVCDLASPLGLPLELAERPRPSTPRIVTFFGMMPNFEPGMILPRLADLVQGDDLLLVSANLAPGRDYNQGVLSVASQYDNDATRRWLMLFLLDLGFEESDGNLLFEIRKDPANLGLARIEATFLLQRDREVVVGNETFQFRSGERIRLFFSYRHTPALVRSLLAPHGFVVEKEWLDARGEEGVFLVRRRAG
jgi:L-histidine N-alpha-methyltransferase